MCIRDSDSEHCIVLDDVPSLFADKQAIQILLPALDGEPGMPRTVTYKTRDRDERCLLYTSDAADERSSVDLGGRRIIKKKNRSGP